MLGSLVLLYLSFRLSADKPLSVTRMASLSRPLVASFSVDDKCAMNLETHFFALAGAGESTVVGAASASSLLDELRFHLRRMTSF